MTKEEDEDTSELDSLIDFNDEAVEAAEKAAAQKALKEMHKQRVYVEKHSQIRESERSLHFPIFERR